MRPSYSATFLLFIIGCSFWTVCLAGNPNTDPLFKAGLRQVETRKFIEASVSAPSPIFKAFYWARHDSTQTTLSIKATNGSPILYVHPNSYPAENSTAPYMLELPGNSTYWNGTEYIEIPSSNSSLLLDTWYSVTVFDDSSIAIINVGNATCASDPLQDDDVMALLAQSSRVVIQTGNSYCFYTTSGFNGTCVDTEGEESACVYNPLQSGRFWFYTVASSDSDVANFTLSANLEYEYTSFRKYQHIIIWCIVGVGAASLAVTAYAVLAIFGIGFGMRS